MRRTQRHRAGRAPVARLLRTLAVLSLTPVAATPGATVARPCAANPLCVCRGDHLACDFVPFHRFPETEAGALHVAVCAARLAALDEAALHGRALRTLVLVGSRLHHIDTAALASMTASLASLDLGHNEFTEIPIAALRSLRVLNWLNLQNNDITELDPATDWGGLADSLSTLSLSNNRICVVRAGTFTELRQLVQLELDGNRLRQLEPTAAPPSLAMLRLSDNLLSAFPCGALVLLPRLRHLHLRNNMLRPISNGTCRNERSKIDSLDLSHNDLADGFRFEFRTDLRLKRLVLDLNDFTAVPPFVMNCGHLETLSISYNSLQRVTAANVRAFRHSLQKLELDHNELAALPVGVRELERLRHLSLAYNRLDEVEDLPPKLHTLSLAGNLLTTFPAGLQKIAPASLVYLDLGYNRISYVLVEHFDGWAGALTSLNLRGNRLARLAPGNFPSLPLRELMLSFNDLYRVEPGALANLTELRVLELSSALFGGEIASGLSAGTLTWLTLDNNDIHFVSSDDLLGFASLEYLNLDFNKITEFPSETSETKGSYKLKELRLAYNYVCKINPEFLGRLTELQSVDLSYNRLQNISERSFSGLQNLVYLNLAGNGIKIIAVGAFADLPKIEILDLQENNLMEFSTEYFVNASSEDASFAVNVSHNKVAALSGGKPCAINVLDLSHNLLEAVPRDFLDALGEHVRQLLLAHNRLLLIDTFAFNALPNLDTLYLKNKTKNTVRRRLLSENPALQVLDLSDNRIARLAPEQFRGLSGLRLLRLDGNQLRALPRDAFRNTPLEYLDLSDNRLALFPSSALARIGLTLRRLELARNEIEYLDAAMFHSTASLHELGLARNALTVLADNALAGLPRLRRLDLSFNAIKANFKELFHGVPLLRRLGLEGAGLVAAPRLPLGELTELELGGNRILSYGESDARGLANLRALGLAGNALAALHPAAWATLPHLAALDVSRNPIARLHRGCFDGLGRLLHLRLDRLRYLETVEPRAFGALASLRSLAVESPAGGGRELPVAEMAAAAPQLEALALRVRREVLDTQLQRLRAPKLRALEVRGTALRRVAPLALAALGGQRALAVRLSGSGVARLPAGLLRPLARVPHLALDLSDNGLVSFGPAALYPNLTGWSRLSTKLLPGGLVLAGNPLRCGCAASWVGAWLRRWTSEVGGGGRAARVAARRSACLAGGFPRPLLALPDHADCPASALAGRASDRHARCPWPTALLVLVLAAASS